MRSFLYSYSGVTLRPLNDLVPQSGGVTSPVPSPEAQLSDVGGPVVIEPCRLAVPLSDSSSMPFLLLLKKNGCESPSNVCIFTVLDLNFVTCEPEPCWSASQVP